MPCIPEDCGDYDYEYRREAAIMVHITKLDRTLEQLNEKQPHVLQKPQSKSQNQECQPHNHPMEVHQENVHEISKSTPGMALSANKTTSNY